jgi:hypothetical protein
MPFGIHQRTTSQTKVEIFKIDEVYIKISRHKCRNSNVKTDESTYAS